MQARKDMFRKSQLVLAIALGFCPVAALMITYLAPDVLAYAWLFPAAYTVLTMLGFVVPGKIRRIYGIAAVLLLVIPTTFLLSQTLHIRTMVFWVALFYGVVLLGSLKIASWGKDKELSHNVIGVCGLLHFVTQFLIVMDGLHQEELQRIRPWMTAAVFVFIGLVLLSVNRKSMAAAGGKRPSISAAMRVKNVLMTIGLFACALVFAFMPSMLTGAFDLIAWITDMLAKLEELLRPDVDLPPLTMPPTTLPVETTGILLDPEKGNPLAGRIAFIIITVVGLIVVIPLALWELRNVIKILAKWLRKLWAFLIRNAANASEDYYEDEITDTREDAALEKINREKVNLRKVILGELNLAPGERIRYRYRRMAKKHPQWRRASTARENLPEEAAALYERARYSDHPITEDDAQRFKASTKQI